MEGVIWYRLPVAGDSLNWSWPAMSEVMAGRAPASALTVQRRDTQVGLIEIRLTNAGPGDYLGTPAAGARWKSGRFVAADGLRGVGVLGPGGAVGATAIEFRGEGPVRLRAGEERAMGWVRLDGASDVVIEIRSEDEPAKRTN